MNGFLAPTQPKKCEHGVSLDEHCPRCHYLRTKWLVSDTFNVISRHKLPDITNSHGHKMTNRRKTSYIASVYSGGEETAKAIAKSPEVLDMLIRVVKVSDLLGVPDGGSYIIDKAKTLLKEMDIDYDNYYTWTD